MRYCCGSERQRQTASATDAGVTWSSTIPHPSTSSGMTDTLVVTTGNPQARASSTTFGNPSPDVG